jgi:hypothetical protein
VFDGLYMRADGGFDARTFECKEGGPPGIVRDDDTGSTIKLPFRR